LHDRTASGLEMTYSLSSLLPGLTRQSMTLFPREQQYRCYPLHFTMDARVKPAHDDAVCIV
jgi:hypothetical protein